MSIVRSATVSAAAPVRWQGLAALVLGVAIVFAAGFVSPAMLHNATHDTRHAFGLPCH
jgi:cobalt transporter subunit CbtB